MQLQKSKFEIENSKNVKNLNSGKAEFEANLPKKLDMDTDIGHKHIVDGDLELKQEQDTPAAEKSVSHSMAPTVRTSEKPKLVSKFESLKLGLRSTAPKNSMDLSMLMKPIPKPNPGPADTFLQSIQSSEKSNRLSLADRKAKISLDFIVPPKPTIPLKKQPYAFNPNTKEALKSVRSKNTENSETPRGRQPSDSESKHHIPSQLPRNKSRSFQKIDDKGGRESALPVTKKAVTDVFSLDGLEDEVNLNDAPVSKNGVKSAYAAKKVGKEREREKKEKIRNKKQAAFEAKQKQSSKSKAAKVKNVVIHDGITVANLSLLLDVTLRQFQFQLVKAGFEEYPADYMLTGEIASMMVLEYNMNPILTTVDTVDLSHR